MVIMPHMSKIKCQGEYNYLIQKKKFTNVMYQTC